MTDNKRSAILAIDFDGTIVEHRFPDIGKLKPFCRVVLKRLRHKGYKIIIWTCRTTQDSFPGHEATIFHVRDFLANHDIPFDTINDNIPELPFQPSKKVYADIYIDDRNLGGCPLWPVIYEMITGEQLYVWRDDEEFDRFVDSVPNLTEIEAEEVKEYREGRADQLVDSDE